MSDVCEDQYASFWEGGETSWSDDWDYWIIRSLRDVRSLSRAVGMGTRRMN